MINSKPVTLFKTALIHRTHSSCRNASENLTRLRSLSFSSTSNSDVNPPSTRNSVSHFFEHRSSFLIKLVYVLRDGIRTNLIKSSGSISFILYSSSLLSIWSLELIPNPPACANFFHFTDMLTAFKRKHTLETEWQLMYAKAWCFYPFFRPRVSACYALLYARVRRFDSALAI